MESNSADWFNAFYAASDNGTAHEEYTTFYTQDAKLMMGDKTAVGQTEILKLRKDLWSEVSSRKHTYRVYTSAARADTYLLEGDVRYTFNCGPEETIKWVAKADLRTEGTERRLEFYQVFLNASSK